MTINKLPEAEKIKGEYYNSFSDDLAILIGSEKDVLLSTSKIGVEPKILANNFSDRVEKNKYQGMGLFNFDTDVIYIDDPLKAAKNYNMQKVAEGMIRKGYIDDNAKRFDIIDILDELNQEATDKEIKKVVFINYFEDVLPAAQKDLSEQLYDGRVNPSSIGVDMAQYMNSRFPSLNVVGIVSGELFEQDDQNKMMMMQGKDPALPYRGFPRLELKGLNTAQAKEFFKKNDGYYKDILAEQMYADLKMGDKALSNLVEKSAIKMDVALPTAAEIALKRLTFAKVNETKMKSKPNAIYYVATKDFETFSETKLFIDCQEGREIIDTTCLKIGDWYYSVSKDGDNAEENGGIIVMKTKNLLDYKTWDKVLDLDDLNLDLSGLKCKTLTNSSLEGPELFQFNKKDWENPDVPEYGLIADQYMAGAGYLPIKTTDLEDRTNAKGSWKILSAEKGEYSFDKLKKRHGTILRITKKELEFLKASFK